jgi:hypothetical protein
VFLTGVSVIWPFFTATSQIVSWLLVAATLACAARLVPHRAPAWVAVLMLVAVWQRALIELQPAPVLLPAAWLLAAVILLAAAEIWARLSGDAALPSPLLLFGRETHSRFVGPLFVIGYGALAFAVELIAVFARTSPTVVGVPSVAPTVSAAMLGVAAVCAVMTVARRSPWLLILSALLVIGAVMTGTVNLIERLGRSASPSDLAIATTALGLTYLLTVRRLERADTRRSLPFFLGGYALLLAAQPLASADPVLRVVVGGFGLLALAATAALVHRRTHATYEAILRRLWPGGPPGPAPALFFALAVWLLPAWLLLLPGLVVPMTSLTRVGLALAAMAVVWVGVGRWGPCRQAAYVRALYLGGYVMSVLGPTLAVPEYLPRVATLTTSVLLYTGSAIAARDSRWLAPVTVLIPVVLWQTLEPLPLFERAYGLGLVLLAAAYLAVGAMLHHGSVRALGHPVIGNVSPWGQRFFAIGTVLAFGGLFRLAFQERDLMMLGYAVGCAYFIASALVFRQPAFGALAVATGTVAYLSALTLTPLPPGWYGVGLVPGSALALALAELARRRLDRGADMGAASAELDWLLGRWSLPLDAAAFGGTFAAPMLPSSGMDAWSAAWWGGAAMLGALALIRRQPAWLYPAIGAGLAGLTTTSLAMSPQLVPSDIATVLIGPVWILIGLTWAFDRRRNETGAASDRAIEVALPALTAPDQLLQGLIQSIAVSAEDRVGQWLMPIRVWGWVTLLASTIMGAGDPLDGLTTAAAYGVLVAFVAQSYRSETHAWGATALAAATFHHWLWLAGVPLSAQPVAWTALALVMTIISIVVRAGHMQTFRAWFVPVVVGSMVAGAYAIVMSLFVPGHQVVSVLATTTAGLGLSLFTHACYGRVRLLLYAGMLALDIGYTLGLIARGVEQVQAFVLPAGLVLLAIAHFESRRHQGVLLKHLAEVVAVTILLGASLLQAVGYVGAGLDRYAYDAFLLLESSAVFGLGALLRWRRTFFAGAIVLVIDVGILLADPIRALDTWYLVAAIGLVMIGGVILVERRRQQIPLWLDEWRARLERWD